MTNFFSLTQRNTSKKEKSPHLKIWKTLPFGSFLEPTILTCFQESLTVLITSTKVLEQQIFNTWRIMNPIMPFHQLMLILQKHVIKNNSRIVESTELKKFLTKFFQELVKMLKEFPTMIIWNSENFLYSIRVNSIRDLQTHPWIKWEWFMFLLLANQNLVEYIFLSMVVSWVWITLIMYQLEHILVTSTFSIPATSSMELRTMLSS